MVCNGLMILPCEGIEYRKKSQPHPHYFSLEKAVGMSELDTIRAKIVATEADLAEAKRVNRSEAYLNNLLILLAEQQKKENILLAQSVPAPG